MSTVAEVYEQRFVWHVRATTRPSELGSPFFALDLAWAIKAVWAEWAAAHNGV